MLSRAGNAATASGAKVTASVFEPPASMVVGTDPSANFEAAAP